jgi:hypothetical protein
MPYIGKEPIVGNFQKCDAITVVNGQAAYTLQVSSTNVVPESANHMLVSLNGILQAPVTSFTVSGSTLTFASNLATGDVIDFVILLGNVLDLGTPSDNTVATAKIADDAVTAAKINNDIISGTTALASEPADTDEFLVSDAGTLKRMDYSHIKAGGSTPAFFAHLGSNQTGVSDDTWTKVNFNTEVFDSDGTYDNSSNYRWTPAVAGKYYIFANVRMDGAADGSNTHEIAVYKDGSLIATSRKTQGSQWSENRATIDIIVDADTDDYYEIYGSSNVASGNVNFEAGTISTYFGGFKIA